MQIDSVIRVNHLVQRYGKRTVLHDVSFDVKRGEIIGLLGPSGSGKTTIVKAIAGQGGITDGHVEVLGERMPSLSAIAKIGYMAQADALYQDLTGYENLQFFAELYGIPRRRRKTYMQEVIELVQLQDAIKRPVHTYSGGMKRRLSLAIALQHQPEILILDEPTVGIDPVLRKSFWNEFRKLKEMGVSILITTHVMDEAMHCDRLGMVRNGRLIALGTPEELTTQIGLSSLEEAFLHFGGEAV
jgi:ABC-2 type transport system ATP-binding protein